MEKSMDILYFLERIVVCWKTAFVPNPFQMDGKEKDGPKSTEGHHHHYNKKQLSFESRKPRFLGGRSSTVRGEREGRETDFDYQREKEKDRDEKKSPSLSSSPGSSPNYSSSSFSYSAKDPRKIGEGGRSMSPRGKEREGKKTYRESGEINLASSSFWSEKGGKRTRKAQEHEEPKTPRVEFVVDPLNPPLRLGYLTIKTTGHRWRRRWCALDSNSLHIYKETMQSVSKISLLGGAVKPVADKHTNFVLLTCGDTFHFLCDSPKEMFSWVTSIGDVCENLVMNSIEGKSEKGSENNEKEKEGEGESKEREEMIALMKVEGNNVCADCNAPDPDWASINLGVFICLQCSGVHRSLGSHVSKVRSIHLDDWLPETVDVMRTIGNLEANQMWELHLPGPEHKPTEGSTREEREKYIDKKYVQKSFREKRREGEGLQEEELKYMFLDLLQRDSQFRTQVRALLLADESTLNSPPPLRHSFSPSPSPSPSSPSPPCSPPSSSPLRVRAPSPSPASPSRAYTSSPFRSSSPNPSSSNPSMNSSSQPTMNSSSSSSVSPPFPRSPPSPLSSKSSSLPPPKKPLRLSPPTTSSSFCSSLHV